MHKACKRCGASTERNARGDCKPCQARYSAEKRGGETPASPPADGAAVDKPLTRKQLLAKWHLNNDAEYIKHDAVMWTPERLRKQGEFSVDLSIARRNRPPINPDDPEFVPLMTDE